jgi:hypothetical protein
MEHSLAVGDERLEVGNVGGEHLCFFGKGFGLTF